MIWMLASTQSKISSKESIEVNNNYLIIGKLIISISNGHNVHLDFITISNTNEIMKGEFSYDGSKNHMIYL